MKVARPVRRAGQGNPPRRKAGRAPWSDPYTKLRGPAKGIWFHLYVLIDIYSRFNPGWIVAAREDSLLAKDFIDEAITRNGTAPHTVHADSKYGRCQVFPGFVTLTPIDPRGYRGVGGVLAAS